MFFVQCFCMRRLHYMYEQQHCWECLCLDCRKRYFVLSWAALQGSRLPSWDFSSFQTRQKNRERERSTKREVGRREATISTAVRAANHKMAVHHLLMQEQGLVWSIPGQMRKSACCINFATLIKRYANSSNYLQLRRKCDVKQKCVPFMCFITTD